jgi:hypothetical protein
MVYPIFITTYYVGHIYIYTCWSLFCEPYQPYSREMLLSADNAQHTVAAYSACRLLVYLKDYWYTLETAGIH